MYNNKIRCISIVVRYRFWCNFRYIFDVVMIFYEFLDISWFISMHFRCKIVFCCDCFDACKFYIIICLLWFVVCSSSRIHVLVSHNGEWKQSAEHSGWTFSGKKSKGLGVSRDISYANLIDHLSDLLGFDRSKYYLVLKVVY